MLRFASFTIIISSFPRASFSLNAILKPPSKLFISHAPLLFSSSLFFCLLFLSLSDYVPDLDLRHHADRADYDDRSSLDLYTTSNRVWAGVVEREDLIIDICFQS